MRKYIIKYGNYFLGLSNTECKLINDIKKAFTFTSKKEASEKGRVIGIGETVTNENNEKIFINKRYEIIELELVED